MLLFAPSIEFLFIECDDYAERVRAAARCGAAGVEMWGWQNKDLPALRAALADTGVRAAAMVIDPLVGATAPRAEFLDAVRRSALAAHELACPTVIVISGPGDAHLPPAAQRQRMTDALADAAQITDQMGVTLALEALNTNDHPHTLLHSLRTAIEIVAAVESPALGVVVDMYHTSVMGDRVVDLVEGHEHLVRHVQLAGGPARHEPDRDGFANADGVVHLLRRGYDGYLGLEYRPTMRSADSFRSTAGYWNGAPR